MTDRRVKVYLDGDVSNFNRKILEAAAGARSFSKELDSSTDRMSNLTQGALALGPALVPISAAAVPAIAGLSNQLGFAAAGAGVAVLAFQGVGKALDAVNQYSIEPTDANLQKMHETLATLGPAGQDFVQFLQKARPEIEHLQAVAQAGLFPGVEKGLRSLSGLLPDVEHIIGTISTTLGELSSDAGANLDSPKWHEFIAFLDSEARPTLLAMGKTAGNFAEGLANLWMAFAPLSDNFSRSFLGLARDFASWTDGLDKTQGFQEFIDYVNKEGPKAWDTLGSLADTLLQIVEAAAPVGAATLPVIKALSDSVATLANSDLGPLVIGVVALTSALSRMKAVGIAANTGPLGSLFKKSAYAGIGAGVKQLGALTVAQDAATLSAKNLGRGLVLATGDPAVRSGFVKAGVAAAGLGIVMSGTADKIGLSNTASLALAGSLAGPVGAAVGGGIGLVKDLSAANDGLWTAVSRANAVLDDNSSTLQDQAAAVDAARQKVLDLEEAVNSGTPKPSNIFKSLKDGAEGLFGKSDIEEAKDALKGLETLQQKNIEKAQDQQFAEAGLATTMYGTTQAAKDQATALLKLVDAHNTLADTLLGEMDKQVAYEQAIDAATKAAKDNGRTLDINTTAGQNNQLALDRLAASWNDLTPAQQNAKGASERARAEFIKAAEQMGANGKKARDMADDYLDIPTDVSTDVHLYGVDAATKAARDLAVAIGKIPKLTKVQINTYEDVFTAPKKSDPKPSLKNMLKPASGGFITGPGGPRDDLIPAMVSNGEFVVNAAATSRHLALLHSINAQGFAAGGPVLHRTAPGGYLTPATSTPSPQYARLVDPTVRVHKDGLVQLVDDRVELISGGNDNYAAAGRRAGR